MSNHIQVVTHDGIFHADELLACAALSIAYGRDNVAIIRSRDSKVLEVTTQNKDTWVIDVGNSYDPSLLNFDHHMRDFNLTNSFGNKLSSFGMVVEELLRRDFFNEVKESLLKFSNKVDMLDNGVKKAEDLLFLSVLNSYSDNEVINFYAALETATSYLRSLINQWKEERIINMRLNDSLGNMTEDGIIYNTDYIPVDERANAIPEAKLVIYKNKQGTYNIQSVNVGETKDFSVRCPAPSKWLGLCDNELIRASGGLPLIFCHVGGFLTVTSTDDLDEALRVARIIINTPQRVQVWAQACTFSTLDMNILNLKLDKEKVVIAKIKVVVLDKHGMPIWVEFKNTLSQALYYYEDYKDKDLGVYQTIQLIAYDNTTSLIIKQHVRQV